MPGAGRAHGLSAFPAMVFTLMARSPRCAGFLATVTGADHRRRFGISIGMPGPRAFTSASQSFVGAIPRAAIRHGHRITGPRFVTIAKRPSCGR